MGIAVAAFYIKIDLATAALVVLGIFFAHISVNVLDDYVDFRKGIDAETAKTKFSGGSSMLVDGTLKPDMVLLIGLLAFAVGAVIGIYIIVSNPLAIAFVAIGGISILLYAVLLVRVPFLAEPLVAIDFMAVVLGSFVVIMGSFAHIYAALIVAFPAGSMVGLALLMNEVPDRKVDQRHGRRSGAVMLKSKSSIAYYYFIWEALCYAVVMLGIIYRIVPYTEIIILAISPLIVVCFMAVRRYSTPKRFEKYMGFNALHSLLLTFLLFIGYIIVML
ncbi:MAG: prenyltransferase [Candidatus Micrarchaeaceae archaeon]